MVQRESATSRWQQPDEDNADKPGCLLIPDLIFHSITNPPIINHLVINPPIMRQSCNQSTNQRSDIYSKDVKSRICFNISSVFSTVQLNVFLPLTSSCPGPGLRRTAWWPSGETSSKSRGFPACCWRIFPSATAQCHHVSADVRASLTVLRSFVIHINKGFNENVMT